MKKLLSYSILIVGVLGLLLFFIKKWYIRTAVIGNSDGPTSVFIAGKYSDFTPVYFIIGVPILIVLYILRKK